jgi:glycosyltransferase involved in cell wall biosynthesis
MRCLFLATDAFGGHGGIAQSNRDFLKAISLHPKCDEIVCLPRLAPGHWETLPEKVIQDRGALGGKVRYTTAVLRSLCKDFDFVICAHINLLPFGTLAKKVFGLPVLLVIYGIDIWDPSLFARAFAKDVDGVISVSRLSLEKFLGWSGVKRETTCVLPNAGHLDRFSPGPKNPELLRRYGLVGKKVLLTLGRLSADERYKGIDEVLQVMPEMLRTEPNLVYMVVGDGSDRGRLEEKANGLGIKEQVRFTGRVSEEEKVDHYRLADAFVLCGFGEGFGIVCLEALACGIPVVGSTLDATREALKEGELGFLADPRDGRDLQEKLWAALAVEERIVKPGLEFIDEDHYTRRCHQVLDQFLGKP